MEDELYFRFARKLADGLSDRRLRTARMRGVIDYLIRMRVLELWEINDEILCLTLFSQETVQAAVEYAHSTVLAPKPLREQDYTWMYQLTPEPPRLGDFNDYFICAIMEKDSAYFLRFLHHYESVLNAMARRFLDFYFLPQDLFADLKQTFVLTLWEQFLKYDAENAIPLLQIAHPIVKKQWHTMVARKIGALTMPEKVYAVWRKVAAISNKCRQEGLSQGEREARVYAAFPESCHRAVKRALAMLATWREPMPLVTGGESETDQGCEAVCACEESIADANAEPIDAGLWREEVFKAFKIAFRALSWKEKELFGKINGIDPDTMELIEPTDRETLAMTHNYADESGVRKAELEITVKLAAELCKIGFADAVSVKKISPPEGYPKAKHLIYYNYFPLCGKEGGLMVVNTKASTVTSGFRVLRVAEDDTMNSRRYAMLAAKGLERERKESADGKLPARLLVARHAHTRTDYGTPMQLAKRWSAVSSDENEQESGGK